MASTDGEALCLKWNNYTSNLSETFQDMRKNEDFFDLTLITDDGELRCHKLVLGACSPQFRQIIKRLSTILNPAIYLRGIRHQDLKNIIEFIYVGQVNVAHDELDTFLAAAEDLCIKGLTQPENTSFCAATTSSNSTSYQPPTKKSKQTPKQKSNKNSFRTPKSEPQDMMDHEYNEEMNIENEDYFTEKPFMKSYEPMFTLKDQIGDKLKLACNRCPTFDENGKFIQKVISASINSRWALRRHLRSCHTIEDSEEFDIICASQMTSGKGSAGLSTTPEPNPDPELRRNSSQNLNSLKNENRNESVGHDESQNENNVDFLDESINESESNFEAYENFYGEEQTTFKKSYEPLFTLMDQNGKKLRFKCNRCPGEKMISAQVHSNWGLKRHLQNSHTIEDLEEFDSLQRQGKVDDEKS